MATQRTRSDTDKASTSKSDSDDTGKRAAPKKAAPKKAAPKKAAPKKAAPRSSGEQPRSRSAQAPRSSARPRRSPVEIAGQAASQLLELTGREAEGVTSLNRTDDGWTVQIEVVEVRRIPDTTDVLALYEVETDENGDLQNYRRVRRYARGTPGED